MILCIHGFGSCGWGEKSLQIRRFFGVDRVLAPDLPFAPRAAIRHLAAIIDRYPVKALIGSSLGGFYATGLLAHYRLPAVLLNPVIYPHRLLGSFAGVQRRWCDDATFTVDRGYLNALDSLQRETLAPHERYLVLLQQGDEVLDYRQAATFYASKDVVEIPGGNHRFTDFGHYLPEIADWLNGMHA